MMITRFANPEIFLMCLIIPVILLGPRFLRLPRAAIRFSAGAIWDSIPGAVSWKPVWVPRLIRILAITVLIVATARPQSGEDREVIYSEGVDIVVALDISGSMRALDFQPENRLEVAKSVIADFIQKREHDRIGLVLFGTESFTLCPITLDYDLLLEFLKQAQIGMVEEKTAVGKAIANAINRLRVSEEERLRRFKERAGQKDKKAKNQVIILVTDGVNNVSSRMDPITAAKAAEALGIKIYTIGVGTNGMAPFPHPRFRNRVRQVQVELDEETLREIASITGGQYFPARNTQSLVRIFELIDELEKVDIESFKYTRYTELYMVPLMMGLLLLILEVILRQTLYRRFP